jgi:hypothetical protein
MRNPLRTVVTAVLALALALAGATPATADRFAIPDGDGTHRETMIDRLFFDADGSIRPVVPTLDGVDPLQPNPNQARNRPAHPWTATSTNP